MICLCPEGSEVFRVKKSNHSKKIVKQLKKEYKEDLEKAGSVKQDVKAGGFGSLFMLFNCLSSSLLSYWHYKSGLLY